VSEDFDLDAIIGEAEAEAARRRASPGYPHNIEARLEAELARYAPAPGGRRRLEHLVDAVQGASYVVAGPDPGRGAVARLRKLARRPLRGLAEQVTTLGLLIARALSALTARVEDLERRAEEAIAPDSALASRRPARSGKLLEEWLDQLETIVAGLEGRVLYADADATEVVARLRAAGHDAYGLTSSGGAYDSTADVRRADLVDHLGAVDDASLGGVVLAGYPDGLSAASLPGLADALARVMRRAGQVTVISEAPWSWRERVGPVEADLAEVRPLAAETWIASLDRVGFNATAQYAHDGRSFAVLARRRAD
jgi:hypothetical protein